MVSTPRESASEPRAGASEGQGLLGVLRDAAAAWQDRARAAHPAGPRNEIGRAHV